MLPLLLCHVVLLAWGQVCKTNDITLEPLRNGGQGYRFESGTGMLYAISVCEPLDPWTCGYGVGFCEIWSTGNRWIGRSEPKIENLPAGREGVLVTYSDGDFDADCETTWSGELTLLCDPTALYAPIFEEPKRASCVLSMNGRHCSACKAGCNYNGFTSHLPIIKLDTGSGQLQWYDYQERPKVLSQMTVMYAPGVMNRFDERSTVHYRAQAAVNVRGQTSVFNAKKSLSIKTCMPATTNDTSDTCSRAVGGGPFQKNPVSLFGFPAETAWALYAPYSDKTLLRNALIYNISNAAGRYATRVQQVEVFIKMPPYPPREGDTMWKPGDPTFWSYQGIYNLQEIVKRTKGRVEIKHLLPTDNTPPAITGGYLLAMDKLRSYELNTTFWFLTPSGVRVIGNDPAVSDITIAQQNYIRVYFGNMEEALKTSYEAGTNFVDIASFVDYFLIMEFTKNVDGWRWNNFMYKDRNAKLVMGPIWDMDLGFWNANFFNCMDPEGWQYYFPGYDQIPPFWFGSLAQSQAFRRIIAARWRSLRANVWSTERLFDIIDDKVKDLGVAIDRNYRMWPILNQQLWPNPPPFNGSYAIQVQRMKDFIQARGRWVDANIENVGPPPGFWERYGHQTADPAVLVKAAKVAVAANSTSLVVVAAAAAVVMAVVAAAVGMIVKRRRATEYAYTALPLVSP